mmetsp:Transcript_17723/g.44633  ORF Transcript_17723/g.44633 Transcript_17723/m.44633 type:complete len:250 (+) Transcript_17723:533-1282(+)
MTGGKDWNSAVRMGGQIADDQFGEKDYAPALKWDPNKKYTINVTVGQRFMARVTQIREDGFFVDVGLPMDGFVHITRVADGRIKDIHKWVRADDEVEVWAVTVPSERRKAHEREDYPFQLSRRPPVDFTEYVGVPQDTWFLGVVIGWVEHGIKVKVEPPTGKGYAQHGLVQMSDVREGIGRYARPSQEVSHGEIVKVRIKDVSLEKGRMRLSMKPYKAPVPFEPRQRRTAGDGGTEGAEAGEQRRSGGE